MKTVRQVISESPLFNSLSETHLREIEELVIEKDFNKGDAIFFEGDQGIGFYLIAKGQVKVYKLSTEGKEKILHIFSDGEPFGEVAVFSGKNFPANAEAIVKSHLLFFPRTSFIELISGNPSLALNMLAVLAKRLNQFAVQIENLTLKDVPGRLATYLIYLCEESGEVDYVRLTISKGQLASLLGTIPETLSRIFSKMSSQRLISVEGSKIHILDFQGLEELAEHGKFG